MEKESFENEEVAAIMNKNFICIKVDREERPDVDQVYMNAVELMTGGEDGRSIVLLYLMENQFKGVLIIKPNNGLNF